MESIEPDKIYSSEIQTVPTPSSLNQKYVYPFDDFLALKLSQHAGAVTKSLSLIALIGRYAKRVYDPNVL